MTIIRESSSQQYEITSSDSERTEFPFDFSSKEDLQIHCFDVDPNLPDNDPDHSIEIPASDFHVTPASGGLTYGGVITLATPITVGHVLDIQRTTPKTQIKSFSNQNKIIPAEIEDALDRTVMMVQEAQSASNAPLIADIDSLKEADVYLQSQITGLANSKADATELSNYATTQALSTGLTTKADLSHTQPVSSIINLQPTLDAKLNDSPRDGKIYGRKDGDWIESGSGGLPSGGTLGDILSNIGDGDGDWESINSVAERMPKGSDSSFGVVKIDGTTIVATEGILTAIGGGGGEGTTDHRALTHRDEANQHPDTAITHGANTVFNVLESQATAIASKANAADLSGYATTTALNDGLSTKANASHTHPINQITDLQNSLNAKLGDSPSDGKIYGRKDGIWAETTAGGSDDPTVPVGAILPFAGPYAPDTFLFCDGALYAKAEWPELYAAIADYWKQPDDSDTTKFRVPDLRDEFIRGTGSSRTLGTKQGDAIRNITGRYTMQNNMYAVQNGVGVAEGAFTPVNLGTYYFTAVSTQSSGYHLGFDASKAPGVVVADENRPRNAAANFIIKSKNGGKASEEDFTSAVSAINGQYDALAGQLAGKAPVVNYSMTEQDTGRLWVDGKKVYQKTIAFGALPNNAQKNVAHNIDSLAYVISFDFMSLGADGTRNPIPMSTHLLGWVTPTDISGKTTLNFSDHTAFATLTYTCSDR